MIDPAILDSSRAGDAPADLLRSLAERCACGVYVEINPHRDAYLTAREWIAEQQLQESPLVRDVDPAFLREIEARNCIVTLQFYPDTPIGFYTVLEYDIGAALEEAHAALDDHQRKSHPGATE